MSDGGKRGVFVTFEGGEGVGKSTQIARLAARLRAAPDREVVITREPGGTRRAEEIREAVLAGVAKPLGAFAEALLFCAARIDHLDTLIRPALARGAIVLCDRFSDSTRAYQGAAGGVDAGALEALERVTLDGTRPDLTLVLDLTPEAGMARARSRMERAGAGQGADRFESETLGFHVKLREAFRAIALAEPDRCVLIDAEPDADAVEAVIVEAVSRRRPDLLPATEPSQRKAQDDAA